MKTWEEIDVNEVIPLEDFCTLFKKLPLNEEENESLKDYYKMYETFVGAEVKPRDAWITVRNIFAIKNRQIADRLENEKSV
jgi:hypothetical protein